MRNMLEAPSTILEERLQVLHDLATIQHGEQRRAAPGSNRTGNTAHNV